MHEIRSQFVGVSQPLSSSIVIRNIRFVTSRSTLILASGSPRRRDLLTEAGVSFEAIESAVVEVRRMGEGAPDFATRMAREKALAVSAQEPSRLVLGADTIVECGGEILGKPASQRDAKRMLRMLSGATHIVVTAFALARGIRLLESAAIASHVRFRRVSEPEIVAYVATGEPLDKAGAYGIQGMGAGFILDVMGSRDNVMGLPVVEVLAALKRHRTVPKADNMPESR